MGRRNDDQHAYPPPPPPQVVYHKRGMSLAGHGFNWTLVLLTCGMWLPLYFMWWLTVRSIQVCRNLANRRRVRKHYG
ncbi:hypothetical protein [uncultured Thermomonospora sp.]|uniref:hypothetical protein n=1 Tax=uncultured Thermomonospora sp. TaxID=671175 RepID=UPI00259BCFCD|nr:hypothetical protein [uncultured Thermomonospora sp.]